MRVSEKGNKTVMEIKFAFKGWRSTQFVRIEKIKKEVVLCEMLDESLAGY